MLKEVNMSGIFKVKTLGRKFVFHRAIVVQLHYYFSPTTRDCPVRAGIGRISRL